MANPLAVALAPVGVGLLLGLAMAVAALGQPGAAQPIVTGTVNRRSPHSHKEGTMDEWMNPRAPAHEPAEQNPQMPSAGTTFSGSPVAWPRL